MGGEVGSGFEEGGRMGGVVDDVIGVGQRGEQRHGAAWIERGSEREKHSIMRDVTSAVHQGEWLQSGSFIGAHLLSVPH